LTAFVEQSQHKFLSVDGRDAADPKTDAFAVFKNGEVTVLRATAFGRIHVAHDFDATDDGFLDMVGDGHGNLQFPVDAVPDRHFGFVRFEVDVAGPGGDSARRDRFGRV